MALDTSEGWYTSFTATPPFGVALLKRCMNGVIAVGAVFENDWALKPILEQIKPIVNEHPASRVMNSTVCMKTPRMQMRCGESPMT